MMKVPNADHVSSGSTLALLKDLEWSHVVADVQHCPNCDATQEAGHRPYCGMAWHIYKLQNEVLDGK